METRGRCSLLITYSWYHTTRISSSTINTLADGHSESLKDLQIQNVIDNFSPPEGMFTNLTALGVSNVHLFFKRSWITSLVVKTRHSLSSLKLGSESTIARATTEDHDPVLDNKVQEFISRIDIEVRKCLQQIAQNEGRVDKTRDALRSILGISSLHLIGFDFKRFTNMAGVAALPMYDFDKLDSLTLESCRGAGVTLSLAIQHYTTTCSHFRERSAALCISPSFSKTKFCLFSLHNASLGPMVAL